MLPLAFQSLICACCIVLRALYLGTAPSTGRVPSTLGHPRRAAAVTTTSTIVAPRAPHARRLSLYHSDRDHLGGLRSLPFNACLDRDSHGGSPVASIRNALPSRRICPPAFGHSPYLPEDDAGHAATHERHRIRGEPDTVEQAHTKQDAVPLDSSTGTPDKIHVRERIRYPGACCDKTQNILRFGGAISGQSAHHFGTRSRTLREGMAPGPGPSPGPDSIASVFLI
jgi:hypothetical protein